MIFHRNFRAAMTGVLCACLALIPIAPVHAQKSWSFDFTKASGPEVMRVNGKPVFMLEQKNERGGLYRRILVSEGRREFWTDANGDGFIENYEVYTSEGAVRMSGPFRGQFLSMEVEHPVKDGHVLLGFMLDQKKREYKLISRAFRPVVRQFYQNLKYDSLIVGCRGDENEKDLADLAQNLHQAVQSSSENVDKLLTDNLIDKSCKEGNFKDASKYIVKAVTDVAKSDSGPLKPGEKVPKKGRFLQCMRHYNLDVHANRIAAGLAQYATDVKDPFKWKLLCSDKVADQKNYKEGKHPFGSYMNSVAPQPPKVYFHATLGHLKLNMDANKVPFNAENIQNMYSEIFFHEMLHYSMIDHEETVHTIQKCCSKEGNDEGPDCKKLKAIAENQAYTQRVNNTIAKADPNAVNILESANEVFGPEAGRNAQELSRQIGGLVAKYANDPSCKSTDKDALGNCEDKFKRDLRAMMDSSFGSNNQQCVADVSGMTKAKAQNYCSAMRAYVDQIFGLKPGALAALCRKNNVSTCPSGTRSNAALRIFFPFATADEYADGMKTICESCQAKADLNFERANMSYALAADFAADGAPAALNPVLSDMEPSHIMPRDSDNNQAIAVGSGGSGSPPRVGGVSRPGTQQRFPASSDNKGPRPVFYPSQPTERAKIISESFTKTDGFLAQTKKYVSNLVLPQAQASGVQEQTSRPGRPGRESPLGTNDGQSLSGPRLSVGSPLGSGASSSGSRLLANSRSGTDGIQSPRGGNEVPGEGKIASAKADGKSSAAASAAARSSAPGTTSGARQPAQNEDVAKKRREGALAFTGMLKGRYESVKPKLVLPEVVGNMIQYGVQVVDDDGRIHGVAEYEYRLIYSPKAKRLIDDPGSVKK